MSDLLIHAIVVLAFAGPPASSAPTDDETSAQTQQDEGGNRIAPTLVACAGVLLGAWLAGKQIRRMKR